jgi:hypothetical protein
MRADQAWPSRYLIGASVGGGEQEKQLAAMSAFRPSSATIAGISWLNFMDRTCAACVASVGHAIVPMIRPDSAGAMLTGRF